MFRKRQTQNICRAPTGLHGGYASRLSYQLVRNTCQCVMVGNVAETQIAARRFYLNFRQMKLLSCPVHMATDELPHWFTGRTSLPADSGLLCHCCTHTGSSNIAFCTSANCAKTHGSRSSSTNTKYRISRTWDFCADFPYRIAATGVLTVSQPAYYLQCWLALSTISQYRHVCFQHPLQWCNLATSRPGRVSCSQHVTVITCPPHCLLPCLTTLYHGQCKRCRR